MSIAELIDVTENLKPAYLMTYRGLAPDADLPRLAPVLAKMLGLDKAGLLATLKNPPVRLASFGDRPAARKHQMALAKAGCITTLEQAWALADWELSESTPDSIAKRIRRAEERDQTCTFALLRLSQPVAPRPLNEACELVLRDDYFVLNQRDILVSQSIGARDGTGHWSRKLGRNLAKTLPPGTEITSALALCPEDGRTVSELLSTLADRLRSSDVDAGDAPGLSIEPVNWLVAGKVWLDMLKLGHVSCGDQQLDDAERDEIDRHWPLISEDADPDNTIGFGMLGEKRRILIQRFGAGKAERDRQREQLLKLIDNVDNLPTLPAVAMEAYRLAQSPEANADALGEIVGRDPSLTTRILTVVNSPYYGLRAKVDSITHAMVILGLNEVANLALLLSSEKVFRELDSTAGRALWQHSARTAEVARLLAERVPGINASSLYTAALLHDVGKVCLYSCAATQMDDLAQEMQQTGLPGYELERERFGADHAQIGAMLLRQWRLPEHLCLSVERHHGALPGEPDMTHMAALIGLCDHIAHRLDHSQSAGDAMRLRNCHEKALHAYFGELSLESVDLIAEDLSGSMRQLR